MKEPNQEGIYSTPSSTLVEVEEKKPVGLRYYFRGVLLGPLAIIPSLFLPALAIEIYEGDLQEFYREIEDLLFISLIGAGIAYAACLTYGSLVFWSLYKLRKLSFLTLHSLSLIPAIIIGGANNNIPVVLGIGYFSATCCLLCWYAGFRKFKNYTHN